MQLTLAAARTTSHSPASSMPDVDWDDVRGVLVYSRRRSEGG